LLRQAKKMPFSIKLSGIFHFRADICAAAPHWHI
jgi:hypothetical protein